MGDSVAPVADIEKLVAQGRLDRQFLLVGAHWTAVRHLWLSDSERPAGGTFRSDLPPDFWIGCGMPGLADIKPTRSDRFEFAEGGRPAIILPCYDCIPGQLGANPERHVEELRDLVAIDPDRPDKFWRRLGEAVILGNAFLEIAGQEIEPVPVFRNPLTWLRTGGTGIVVLDWDYARDLLLDHVLIAEDLALGDRLAAALAPAVWVMGEAA